MLCTIAARDASHHCEAAAPGAGRSDMGMLRAGPVANLRDLHARVQQGRYRACPSRRACIAKADGGRGRWASPRRVDKMVQRAVVEVLKRHL